MEGNTQSSAGDTASSEPSQNGKANSFEASGLLDPVKQRDYAEKSDIPLQGAAPAAEKPERQGGGILRSRMQIEDDEELVAFEQAQQAQKHVQASPIPEFEMDASGATSPAPYDESSPAAAQMMGQGTRSTSDWIYKNLEVMVPDICHNTSKIDTNKIRKLGLPGEIEERSVDSIEQINENNKKQFTWGQLHEVNIKAPLRDYLTEIGAEQSIPAWFMLLVGVLIVGYVTYGKWIEVKKSNEAIAANLMKSLKQMSGRPDKKEDDE